MATKTKINLGLKARVQNKMATEQETFPSKEPRWRIWRRNLPEKQNGDLGLE